MSRDLMDMVEELEKKLLGLESILSFFAMGMDTLIKRDESYEVSAIQAIHDWLMEIRKTDIANLYEKIDSMNDGTEN